MKFVQIAVLALIGASAKRLSMRQDPVDKQFEEEEAKAAAEASFKARFNPLDGNLHNADGTVTDPQTGKVVENESFVAWMGDVDPGHQTYDGNIHEPDGTVWDPAGAQLKGKKSLAQKNIAQYEDRQIDVVREMSEEALGARTNQEQLEAVTRSMEQEEM